MHYSGFGVERYGSKYGTAPDVMYTSALPFSVGSHRNGVVVKLRVALVQRSLSRMSEGAVHYTVSIANYRCLCRRRRSFL